MFGSYSPWLVGLSFIVALVASYTALDLATRVTASRGTRSGRRWLAVGALSLGVGIWCMHFVGMLAFSLPIAVTYAPSTTGASLLVAVLASGLALATASQPGLSRPRLLFAGLTMGLGISAMHYVGMYAIEITPSIGFVPGRFAASVLVAIVASCAALEISFRLRNETVLSAFWRKTASAVVMALAITGMHYTGMWATHFDAASVCATGAAAMDSTWLATTLSGFTLILLGTTLVVALVTAQRATVRSQLSLMVTICLLPLLAVAMGAISNQYRRERSQLAQNTITTARALTFAVDGEVGMVESALNSLATSPHITNGDLRALHEQATRVVGPLNVTNIYLLNTEGQQLVNTLKPYGSALPKTAAPTTLAQLLDTGHTAISNLFVGVLSGKPVVAVMVPVWKNGVVGSTVTHALVATLEPARLTQVLVQQNLPKSWILSIFDSGGTILARTHELPRFLGKKGSPALLQRMAVTSEGSLDANTVEGIPVVAAYSRSPHTGWGVAIGIPRTEMTADLMRSIGWLLLYAMVLLAVGVAVAWAFGGRIARQVQSLVAPAAALGRLQAVHGGQHQLAEVDAVARALEEASRLLLRSHHDANHDRLTGLANRALFGELLTQQMLVCQRQKTSIALLYIDLDGFKSVNDLRGHAAGDVLLQSVAARMQLAVRASDCVARLGGDEFAALLVNTDEAGASRVADKLVTCLSLPFPVLGQEVMVSASIGVALFPGGAETPDALLRQADTAMYLAKQQGKQRFVVSGTAVPA